jgi:hypothetical protein
MGVIFQLLAQASNADPQDFFIVAVLGPPNGHEQFFSGHYLTHMVGKLDQQAVFCGGKVDWFVISPGRNRFLDYRG